MTAKHLFLLLAAAKVLPMAYPPARKKVVRIALRLMGTVLRRR